MSSGQVASDRCAVCHALLDEEDLFCANCGAESPLGRPADQAAALPTTHRFVCSGCGAAMSYDAQAKHLRCPFCGGEELQAQANSSTLAPQAVVPFAVAHQQAVAAMRQWLGRGFWRPGDLSEQALVVSMTPVYVPYWVFEATTHTYWTADSSQTPAFSRGKWYPLSGEHRGNYRGLLIGGSAALTAGETNALCPFDLSQAVPPAQVDLENFTFEQFSLGRKYARPLAQQGLEQREAEACRQRYVPGQCRNVHVNVLVEGLSSQPVLLPVWIMAYRYREQVFRFLLNGQTGKATGSAPTSWVKVLAACLLTAGAVLLVLLLIALFSAR